MGYFVDTVTRFERELRKLIKKYPHSFDEVEHLIDELEKGNLLGDDIPGLDIPNNKVFKTRLPNSDANKGERGGFRVIYYVLTSEEEIFLLTMYSKSDKEDISSSEIIKIIKKYIHDPHKKQGTS
ncbi:hypothetical protein [Aquibacillus salsiterrae]|uniref:Addiction module toxin RelE n=1 Tax=Aquibacillus salsiterrae TaxID=2950439 RepID=A0A9X3WDV0_9BACI|nr:hypothetical protein [Aquibacillus salsiterrae]MDC3416646.1 hypothetical protein [Aquibacillus salsiterrae]